MTQTQFKDHFSTHSKNYAEYRPRYPEQLLQLLSGLAPARNVVWDCACGTGQLSVPLTDYFEHVIATDGSAEQIMQAEPNEYVEYHVALADQAPLAAQSVDLITVAQAAHWFDLEKFYLEARRVAKPNAVIALISYGIFYVEDEQINQVLQHFYHNVVGQYWPPERRHVENGYQELSFPFDAIELPLIEMDEAWSLEQLIGYISTWSAIKVARQQLNDDPIEALQMQLESIWGDNQIKRSVIWPLTLKVAVMGSSI